MRIDEENSGEYELHVDRGIKKIKKRSGRQTNIRNLREYIDLVNNGDDLEEYLLDDDMEDN